MEVLRVGLQAQIGRLDVFMQSSRRSLAAKLIKVARTSGSYFAGNIVLNFAQFDRLLGPLSQSLLFLICKDYAPNASFDIYNILNNHKL